MKRNPTLFERAVVYVIARVLLSRHIKGKEFLKNILFVFLPFKASFSITILFRNLTGRGDLDAQFSFFCGSKMRDHLEWVLEGSLAKRFFNDIFYYLVKGRGQKEALAIFDRIDWANCETYLSECLLDLAKKICSGYAMDFVVQLHFLDWANCPDAIFQQFSDLVIRMLEHRNFDYEERIFRGRQEFGEIADDIRIEEYCSYFFRDKELILSLVNDLKLEGTNQILGALDRDGQYWEYFCPGRNRPVFSEINRFYAYRHLILRTYHNGEGYLVPTLATRLLETQAALRRSLPVPSRALRQTLDARGVDFADLRILSPDWAALIGHAGHLNVHLMMREMNWWRGSPVLLAYSRRIANRPFLSLFSELCPTLILDENVSSSVWHELASLTPFLGVSHQIFSFDDGRAMYWNDAGAMALQNWETDGRGFPLRDIYDRRLAADDEADSTFSGLRKKWGMGPGDWHVCLHLRDAHTRGNVDGAGESIRNTSFEHYVDAVRYITDQGGWVIRMGGARAPKLPEMPRLIDYARSADQSPIMDIHLVRRAHMFIGTTSGFAYVATSFGIPAALVNAISSVGLLWSKDTRFALKPIRTLDGRFLSQREITSEQWRWAFPTYESLAAARLTVTESTEDEILETVKEVHSIAFGAAPTASPLLDRWRTSLALPAFYGSSVPAAYFLEKYAGSLLADTTSARHHDLNLLRQ